MYYATYVAALTMDSKLYKIISDNFQAGDLDYLLKNILNFF